MVVKKQPAKKAAAKITPETAKPVLAELFMDELWKASCDADEINYQLGRINSLVMLLADNSDEDSDILWIVADLLEEWASKAGHLSQQLMDMRTVK